MPKSLLAIHNAARVWHGAANLTWDADLKSVAADAAEQCRTASALGGTMVSIGQGLDFVQAGLKWYAASPKSLCRQPKPPAPRAHYYFIRTPDGYYFVIYGKVAANQHPHGYGQY